MKKISKILSIILAIIMVISIIPITASAETPTSAVCGKNATWEFDETTSTLTISGEGAMYDFYYHFYSSKETVDTRPWASYDDLIEFVVIDDGITHIGEYAFLDFDLLTIITIPDSVTSIGEYAFEEAEPLVVHYKGTETQWNNVTIGGANTGLYYERTRIYFVDFPISDSGTWHENITWSFDADTSTLTISGTGIMNADFGDLYHPNKKQFRGNRGWDYYKYHIEQVVITDGVTQIGGDVFRYHPNLKKVIIPKSIHTIDIGALDSGKSLSDIYYSGTEENWNNINIRECSLLGKPNSSYKPNNANIHFLGEEVHECSYNAVVTAPTCTEQGYTTYTCSCGDSYVADYVDKIGHNYDSVVTPPTCTEQGYTIYTCECGDSYADDYVDATGHSYDSVVTQPTCTEQGYTTYTCECGDSYIDDYIDETGHNYVDNVCTGCGDTIILNGWQLEDGKWAYYVNNEKLTNKWIKDSVDWCYLGADGYCLTNAWAKDSIGWCYLDSNGRMIYNKWLLDNGKWYFIDANGYMVSSKWMKDSKDWVYLGSSGAMLTNAWAKDSQGWCYVGNDGYWIKSQWIEYNNNWYYIDSNGYMVTGTVKIGPTTHKFTSNGVWIG